MKNGQGFLDTQYVDAVYPAVYPVSGFLRGPDIRSSPSISMNIQKKGNYAVEFSFCAGHRGICLKISENLRVRRIN